MSLACTIPRCYSCCDCKLPWFSVWMRVCNNNYSSCMTSFHCHLHSEWCMLHFMQTMERFPQAMERFPTAEMTHRGLCLTSYSFLLVFCDSCVCIFCHSETECMLLKQCVKILYQLDGRERASLPQFPYGEFKAVAWCYSDNYHILSHATHWNWVICPQ